MPAMEAMAAGLAVVATRCLGVESFARHGVNALLADTQVREGCAAAVRTCGYMCPRVLGVVLH